MSRPSVHERSLSRPNYCQLLQWRVLDSAPANHGARPAKEDHLVQLHDLAVRRRAGGTSTGLDRSLWVRQRLSAAISGWSALIDPTVQEFFLPPLLQRQACGMAV